MTGRQVFYCPRSHWSRKCNLSPQGLERGGRSSLRRHHRSIPDSRTRGGSKPTRRSSTNRSRQPRPDSTCFQGAPATGSGDSRASGPSEVPSRAQKPLSRHDGPWSGADRGPRLGETALYRFDALGKYSFNNRLRPACVCPDLLYAKFKLPAGSMLSDQEPLVRAAPAVLQARSFVHTCAEVFNLYFGAIRRAEPSGWTYSLGSATDSIRLRTQRGPRSAAPTAPATTLACPRN